MKNNKIINTPQSQEENKKIIIIISEFKGEDSKIEEKKWFIRRNRKY